MRVLSNAGDKLEQKPPVAVNKKNHYNIHGMVQLKCKVKWRGAHTYAEWQYVQEEGMLL